mgnify:CR=1 FL=1
MAPRAQAAHQRQSGHRSRRQQERFNAKPRNTLSHSRELRPTPQHEVHRDVGQRVRKCGENIHRDSSNAYETSQRTLSI